MPNPMTPTDKPQQLEKLLTDLRAKHFTYAGLLQPRAGMEQLIGLRAPVRASVLAAANALMCSVLYGDNSFLQQLTAAKTNLEQLGEEVETRISARIQARAGELASARLLTICAALSRTPGEEGWTAALCEGQVQPIYFVRWNNVPDVSGFVHDGYSLWFRSNREFCSGFDRWPPDEGWERVRNLNALSAAMRCAIERDGLQ